MLCTYGIHLINMSLKYGRSKGVREYRLEEPPLGNLAARCHQEEGASHHIPCLPFLPCMIYLVRLPILEP